MSNTVIGKCSLCGGPVSVPTVWMSVVPPVPTCKSCGAVKDELPVVEMRPPIRGYPPRSDGPIRTKSWSWFDLTDYNYDSEK